MGMKDKAMFALYLAAKKRKANNNRQSSNNYDDDGYDGFDDHDENVAWVSCIPRRPSTTVCIAAQRSGWATSSKYCSNKRYDYGWFTMSRMWMPRGCNL